VDVEVEMSRAADSHVRAYLTVEVSFRDGIATLSLYGELDYVTAEVLSEELTQALGKSPERLVFDMGGLAFTDCTGARIIAAAGQALPDAGRPVLRSPRPVVRRLLELTGLDALVTIEE
jgi:anti-sigma B factor antagonist